MNIRHTVHSDLDDILHIEREAFGSNDVPDLVEELLSDPGAEPVLSLLAFHDNRPVGHILFTAARLSGHENSLSVSILAPLAILPEFQNTGYGNRLINYGLNHLKETGVDLVFVLGHPGYYPRSGFEPAGMLGLQAPYPIPDKNADAWMVKALRPGITGSVTGTVVCCNALNKPEHWRE